jgi:hypothetical protein
MYQHLQLIEILHILLPCKGWVGGGCMEGKMFIFCYVTCRVGGGPAKSRLFTFCTCSCEGGWSPAKSRLYTFCTCSWGG